MIRNPKPYLLYGTPRSGSTLCYGILSGYLLQNRLTIPLHEYFNLGWTDFHLKNGAIVRTEPDWVRVNRMTPRERTAEMEKRFRWLKKGHGNYSLKVLAGCFKDSHADWFRENYTWVFIERRNLFEQVLSYLISRTTNQWYVPGGIRLKKCSLEADPGFVEDFAVLYGLYLKNKARVKKRPVVYYEDIAGKSDFSLMLKSIGLRQSVDFSCFKLPLKQNENDKLSLFRNPAEIVDRYRQTFLNDLAPAP